MMNEFTKEELKKICETLWIADDLNDSSDHQDLIFKLQRMINNYCEHKWAMEYTPHRMCHKCQVRK